MADEQKDMSRYSSEGQPRSADFSFKKPEKSVRKILAGLAITSVFLGAGAQESKAQDVEKTRRMPGPEMDMGSVSQNERNQFAAAGLEIADAALQQTPEFPVGSRYAVANPQEGYQSINVRASQSINAEIVTRIPRGERIVVNLPEDDADPNDGWYEIFDANGNHLGFVHNSVFRFEGTETPPTPTAIPIGPTPVQEAPTSVAPGETEGGGETTTDTSTGETTTPDRVEATGIPEVINPTHEPVLAPTYPESVINATRDPDYARNIGIEIRQREAELLEQMDLQPLPAEEVSWITYNGEQLPMGIIDNFIDPNDILQVDLEQPNHFAFSGILRGVREFQAGGQNLIMMVVDVNNNRIVITELVFGGGDAWGLLQMPREGDVTQAQYTQVNRLQYQDILRNAQINQQIVMVAYPSTGVNDEFTRATAAAEISQLTYMEQALRSDAPITDPQIGLWLSSAAQRLVLQHSS